jgi:cytochrome oxidase Cu insertion factor (SCO1/SenC/PrrC family)
VSGPTETEGDDARAGAPVRVGSELGPGPLTPGVDRSAALAEGAPGIPAHFVWWVLGVVLALSLGGLLVERVFSSAGLNSAAVTPTTAPNPVRTVPAETPAPPNPDRAVGAPLPAFMSLSTPSPRLMTPFNLTDQYGQPLSVPTQPARVVVLTFFDAPCKDICPVLASEIEQADADLGAHAGDVEFVTVNTDLAALAPSAEAPALATGLAALPNWRMVTGPLASLDPVWKAYGVSITLNTRTGLEAHSDAVDFIDPQGFLRYRATPFADESRLGSFSLPAADEARWGQGLAAYAERLIGQ